MAREMTNANTMRKNSDVRTRDGAARSSDETLVMRVEFRGSVIRSTKVTNPTAMLYIYEHLDRALERWARRKYNTLSGRKRGSAEWLRKMKDAKPKLFHHWCVVGDMVG
jgi:hypothetical protein